MFKLQILIAHIFFATALLAEPLQAIIAAATGLVWVFLAAYTALSGDNE